MTLFFLIRHGVNDFVGKRLAGHLPGVHLNDRGKQQAEVIAQALSGVPIKAIYSSPLERAVETAEPLARALNLPVNLQPDLGEVDFGEWQGLSIGRLRRKKLWKTVQEKPSEMRFPGGESFTEAQIRMVRAITTIAAAHDEKDLIACFSHADSIRLLVTHSLGMPLDNFQRINIDTATLTILGWGKEAAFLGSINLYLFPSMVEDLRRMFQPPKPKKTRKPKPEGGQASNGKVTS